MNSFRKANPGTSVLVGLALMLGAASAGGMALAGVGSLPSATLTTALLALAAMPLIVTRVSIAVGVFLVWLIFEDLMRKLAGNDIRIYFVKDLLFLIILLALLLDPRPRGVWKTATGRVRIPLYVLICWGVVMSIPTGFVDWRLPIIGLRLDFMYVPLTAVGFLLVATENDWQKWLWRISLLAGVASAIGILQAVIGPEFLSPGRPTPGLHNLVLVRGLPDGQLVYRPTGTFVDPGRFASMALIGVSVALATLLARGKRLSPLMIAAGLSAAGAVWISGGRTAVIVGALLLAAVVLGPRIAESRASLSRVLLGTGTLLLALALTAAFLPTLFSSRAEWYRDTLDPGSVSNEWRFRTQAVLSSMSTGISRGGMIGKGTGEESLGQNYLYGGPDRSLAGLYEVEGGYAAVLYEWGWVGLVMWMVWSIAWTGRLWRSIKSIRGSPLASAGLVLLVWIIFFLFIGFVGGKQGFQNYLANAYFWLLSGMIFALPEAARATRLRTDRKESSVADVLT